MSPNAERTDLITDGKLSITVIRDDDTLHLTDRHVLDYERDGDVWVIYHTAGYAFDETYAPVARTIIQDRPRFNPLPVLEGTVDDVRERLETGEYDTHLSDLAAAEEQLEDRKTVLQALVTRGLARSETRLELERE